MTAPTESRSSRVVIIGGRGTAVVVAEQLQHAIDRYGMKAELLGFAFDDETLGAEVNGIPILCKTYETWERFRNDPSVEFIYQMYRGDVIRERALLLESFGIPLERMYTFIHPSAVIARSATIGLGTVICANVVVNPNVRIGSCVTVNSGCLIGHDSTIEDYGFLAAHVSVGSNVRIGEATFIGLNATIRNFIDVGAEAVIGAAANVVKPVAPKCLTYGNPARHVQGLGGPIR